MKPQDGKMGGRHTPEDSVAAVFSVITLLLSLSGAATIAAGFLAGLGSSLPAGGVLLGSAVVFAAITLVAASARGRVVIRLTRRRLQIGAEVDAHDRKLDPNA